VFASTDSTADERIISRIKRSANPGSLLVVSSDHDIQSVARRAGARVMTAPEFASKMTQTHAPKHRRRKRVYRDRAVSAREVEEWLAAFRASKE
jgi:predicted RNA-binding protein with PIN domain